MSDVRLAYNWPKTRVKDCFDAGERLELVRFLRERYQERFFGPIRHLREARGNEQGHGFAVMALCCLLIETLASYRRGLPSTSAGELKALEGLAANKSAPPEHRLAGPFKNVSGEVFDEFFKKEAEHFFPGVDGGNFYENIRCGLLHQAQTKDGWRIVRSGRFWEGHSQKSVNRDEFADRLEEYFDHFLKELNDQQDLSKDPWPNVRRKIFWLLESS